MAHHIVLISFDALRPDRLGDQGQGHSFSPNMDALRKQSVAFESATSPTTWTLPGHMSMLSGLAPLIHGCVSATHRYPPETLPFPLIFGLLGQQGYGTLSVTGGGYMEPQFGFGLGADKFCIAGNIIEAFDTVADHIAAHERSFSFLHSYIVHDYPMVQSSPHARRVAEQWAPRYSGAFPTDRDFPSLLRDMASAPTDTEVDEHDLAYLNALYASAVGAADSALRSFTGRMEQEGRWDDVTLIVTADHGESLGDPHLGRRFWSHGGPPYQDQLRVPLLLRPAACHRSLLEPGLTLHEPVSLFDIVPTILDLEGVPHARDQFDGTSLVELALGQVAAFETRRLVHHSCEDAEDRYLEPHVYGSAFPWRQQGKLIYDHRSGALREFYRLEDDPREQINRIDELQGDELKQIDEMIAAYYEDVSARAKNPPATNIEDPVLLDRLAQLGYLDE